VVSVNASAHLFDSVADCDKRYGKPAQIDGDKRFYEKNGFAIYVHIYKGKVDCITYGKISGKNMSETEIIHLIGQNQPAGTTFVRLDRASFYTLCDEKTLERDTREGGVYAFPKGDALCIMTYNFKSRLDAKDYENTSGL
jgi:hypothetical protein